MIFDNDFNITNKNNLLDLDNLHVCTNDAN